VRRCKSLRRLRKTLSQRISRLEKRLRSVAANNADKHRDVVVAYVAIEALNAWALFSRSFYLSCALGAKTERRRPVTLTATTADPLGAAITCCNSRARPNAAGMWHRRDEPAWHDPNILMRVCGNVGCSIQSQIGQAFSLNQNVFNDLPVFRNFFAHRNGQTSQAARNIAPRYTLPSKLSPTDLLLAVSPGATEPVMIEWLTEITITAEFLCKG
jgi:hypothetical protein